MIFQAPQCENKSENKSENKNNNNNNNIAKKALPTMTHVSSVVFSLIKQGESVFTTYEIDTSVVIAFCTALLENN